MRTFSKKNLFLWNFLFILSNHVYAFRRAVMKLPSRYMRPECGFLDGFVHGLVHAATAAALSWTLPLATNVSGPPLFWAPPLSTNSSVQWDVFIHNIQNFPRKHKTSWISVSKLAIGPWSWLCTAITISEGMKPPPNSS